MPPKIRVQKSSVRKVCQLTGEMDRQRQIPAYNRTETRFGLYGTDLGSSFEHDGRLWFLFGDTRSGSQPGSDSDSVASTTAKKPIPGIRLEFVNDQGRYRSPQLIGTDGAVISTGAYEVPVAGFSADGQMYVFYTTDRTDEKGNLDLFWINKDGAVSTAWAKPIVDNGVWHAPPPITVPGAARIDSPLAVITRFEGAKDLFWIGPDGAVDTTWANPNFDNGSWHPFFPITSQGAARIDSPLAVITRFDGAMDVFWIGPDGSVNTTWANPFIDNGNWHPFFAITPPWGARANSPVSVITRFNGALDVFWVAPDGAVNTTWANPFIDNGNWHPPFPITAPWSVRDNSSLSVITRFNGALDVFWVAPDGSVNTTWSNPLIDNNNWHPSFPITSASATRANSPLSVITRLEGALDVFWIAPDGAVNTTWSNPTVDNGIWHPFFPITSAGATRANSPLSVITRFNGALDVFLIAPDGTVSTPWSNPDIDNGIWHSPYAITVAGVSSPSTTLSALTSGPGYIVMGRTVLAAARNNDPTDLHALYDFSVLRKGGKFINVACVIAPHGLPGLPFKGPALLAWGSGRYRASNVYFGCAPLQEVHLASAWHYLTGIEHGSRKPQWGSEQTVAAPLFIHPQVGELSVTYVKSLKLWLMLYNALSPRGINARVAHSPWGPWSDPVLIFDPRWPQLGYGNFMHDPQSSDKLSDPGRQGEYGGEYGPYLIDRYTHEVEEEDSDTKQARVYFVMSTWNPYNTVLMTATIQRVADGHEDDHREETRSD